jgi:hypothetical protein
MIGVIMADATIDGLVGNLVINGVEVSAYVEAELAPGTGAGADPIGRSD